MYICWFYRFVFIINLKTCLAFFLIVLLFLFRLRLHLVCLFFKSTIKLWTPSIYLNHTDRELLLIDHSSLLFLSSLFFALFFFFVFVPCYFFFFVVVTNAKLWCWCFFLLLFVFCRCWNTTAKMCWALKHT